MKKMVSLTIPCYNEGEFIFKAVKRLENLLGKMNRPFEIILFDDKSTDKTADNIRKIAAENSNAKAYFHTVNQGRGQTVKDAIAKARGEIVGFLDIDLEVSEKYIPKLVEAIDNGFDVSIGDRHTKITWKNIHRFVLSRGYNKFTRVLLKIKLKDTESGCKFFNKKKIAPILAQTKNKHWFWDTEIMAIAYYEGLKIKEIPVEFEKNPETKSTVKIFSDTKDYVKEIFQFRERVKKEGKI